MQCVVKIGRYALVLLLLCALIVSCSKNSTGSDDDGDGDTEDIFPPSAISDMSLVSVTTSSITLQWTAPGDDSTTGVAYEYDLRISDDTITSNNFLLAFRFDDIDSPVPAGLTQVCTINDLTSGQKYYFAVKTRDDIGNWSNISNGISTTCLTNQVVVFPDTVLERLVREELSLPTGDIETSDLQNLVELFGDNQGVTDLTGLEYCFALVRLGMMSNNISDLTPLAGLTSLDMISLIDNNVTDLSPLINLVNLKGLFLGQNNVSDISPLQYVTSLEHIRLNETNVTDFSPIYDLPALNELDLSNNSLGDIGFISNFTQIKIIYLTSNGISNTTPLAALTGLEKLGLVFNQITDVSALSGLTSLIELDLRYNQITDISPLVSNSGLGSGDELYLTNNPLNQTSLTTHIPTLEARGVTVYH
ncbi:MAG: leucine-rich repeat domain-containing protein [bacterium]